MDQFPNRKHWLHLMKQRLRTLFFSGVRRIKIFFVWFSSQKYYVRSCWRTTDPRQRPQTSHAPRTPSHTVHWWCRETSNNLRENGWGHRAARAAAFVQYIVLIICFYHHSYQIIMLKLKVLLNIIKINYIFPPWWTNWLPKRKGPHIISVGWRFQ